MMKFMPTWYCNSIYDLDLSILKENEVKYILTDLDNTLAPYNIATPNYETIALISKLKTEGFIVIIVSNNTGRRVKLFSDRLDVKFIAGAKKPFTSTIKRYLSENNIDIKKVKGISYNILQDNLIKAKTIVDFVLSHKCKNRRYKILLLYRIYIRK